MATYYVGIGGNDASDGTSWANRKLTFAAGAALCTSAGDTLKVGPGVYTDSTAQTLANAGSSGSPITYEGDYTGASTDGVGGPVVLNNTANGGPSNYVLSAEYQIFRGFTIYGLSTTAAVNVAADNVTVEDCYIYSANIGVYVGPVSTTSQSNTTLRRLFIAVGCSRGIYFRASADDAGNTGNIVENCIFTAGGGNIGTGVQADNTAGVTIRNCLFLGCGDYGVRATSLPTSESITVNNCVIAKTRYGIHASASGEITENYNAISNCITALTNVTGGANSVTTVPDFDTRWFFEATLGNGTLVTPFDLASYSALVELNSGTGAPSADFRGTTVQGTYREWGVAEYLSTLDIEAGAAGGGGGPVIGSRVIQGLGAI